jgi:hypothetical protein
MNDMLKHVLELQNNEDKVLDYIYDYFDKEFRAGEFEACNTILVECDVTDFSLTILIGFLTTSMWAKSKLPNRPAFYNRVKKEIERREGVIQPGLLDGLEP